MNRQILYQFLNSKNGKIFWIRFRILSYKGIWIGNTPKLFSERNERRKKSFTIWKNWRIKLLSYPLIDYYINALDIIEKIGHPIGYSYTPMQEINLREEGIVNASK